MSRRGARRSDGSEDRWKAIEPILDSVAVRTAVDLGSNVGWFSIMLAQRGITTVAVESFPKYYRPYLFALERMSIANAGLLTLPLRPDTVHVLPRTDATLFLSLWHHLVKGFGLPAGVDLLETVWQHTSRVLFFETGENELPASYGLPEMTPSGQTWVFDLLTRACAGGEVTHLGRHAAFAPSGAPCERSLFAVLRSA